MTKLQSIPNRIACSEYCLQKDGRDHYFGISIYSPNYQEDGLASHWRSRVIIHDNEGAKLDSVSGIGGNSMQALSCALYMICVKLTKYSEGINPVSILVAPNPKQSYIKLLSTHSESIMELSKPIDEIPFDKAMAELGGLKITHQDGKSEDFKVIIGEPEFIDDIWYCTTTFSGLNVSNSFSSGDSTLVIAKAFRGIHRQFLEWNKDDRRITFRNLDVSSEKFSDCYFTPTIKLVIVRTQEAAKHIEQKNFASAIEVLSELNSESSFIPVYYLLGLAMKMNGAKEYSKHFDEALILEPSIPIEYLYKGKIYEALGNAKIADQFYKKAQSLGCKEDYIDKVAKMKEQLF